MATAVRSITEARTNGVAKAVPVPMPDAQAIAEAAEAIRALPPLPLSETLLTAPLSGRLDGHHVVLDEELITFGFLRGLASNQPEPLMDALVGVIVDGSLFSFPPEAATDPEARREAIRVGLSKLHIRQIAPLLDGIRVAVSSVPKGS